MKSNFNDIVTSVLSKKKIVIVSGLHGDEPAGNIVCTFFKHFENVYIISDINNTNKRRLNGKDLNRHFDTTDEGYIQNYILQEIENIKPELVICLHEDDEVNGMYVYCSQEIEDLLKQCLQFVNIKIAKSAHKEHTNKGVISHGKQPYRGTLERALKKRNVLYCTIETPVTLYSLKHRVDCMRHVVDYIIKSF